MLKPFLAGLAIVLVIASARLWMLRAGSQRPVGSAAPEFALPDQNGQIHRLGDYAGRWLVLYFYPRDDTPGCRAQACSLRDDIASLNELGAAVVGVSVDDVASHADFARKFMLPFPLLADTQGETAAAYGSLVNLGVARFARRYTFIIDPRGRIAARFDTVDTARHAAEVAQVLRQLQAAGS